MIRDRSPILSLSSYVMTIAYALAAVAWGADPPQDASPPVRGAKSRLVAVDPTIELPSQPMRATIARREYRPLDPIVVNLEAVNRSKWTWVETSDALTSVTSGLIVSAPGSKPSAETAYARHIRMRFTMGKVEFYRPGEVFHSTFVANLLRDMTAPGEYTISVTILLETTLPGGRLARVLLRADPITVMIQGQPIAN